MTLARTRGGTRARLTSAFVERACLFKCFYQSLAVAGYDGIQFVPQSAGCWECAMWQGTVPCHASMCNARHSQPVPCSIRSRYLSTSSATSRINSQHFLYCQLANNLDVNSRLCADDAWAGCANAMSILDIVCEGVACLAAHVSPQFAARLVYAGALDALERLAAKLRDGGGAAGQGAGAGASAVTARQLEMKMMWLSATFACAVPPVRGARTMRWWRQTLKPCNMRNFTITP